MRAEAAIRDYYEALRDGETLSSHFAGGDVVKFGVSESLFGADDVADALHEQTRTTENWLAESDHLVVTERESVAWFADRVRLAWTDRETGDRHRFETRWSGTLERRDGTWLFVSMHVSAPHDP